MEKDIYECDRCGKKWTGTGPTGEGGAKQQCRRCNQWVLSDAEKEKLREEREEKEWEALLESEEAKLERRGGPAEGLDVVIAIKIAIAIIFILAIIYLLRAFIS